MILLVCGGRTFDNWEFIYDVLGNHLPFTPTHMITGGAEGADTHADFWAWEHGVQPVVCRANWPRYDKAAGAIRNRRMGELRPGAVLAFPGGRGTAHMLQVARDLGITRYIASPETNPIVRKEDGHQEGLEPSRST